MGKTRGKTLPRAARSIRFLCRPQRAELCKRLGATFQAGDLAISSSECIDRSYAGANGPLGSFFAAAVPALLALPETPFDLYIQTESTRRKTLYRSSDAEVRLADDKELADRGVQHLHIREEDRPKFEEALFAAPAPAEANGRLALTIERRRGAFKRALVGGCPKAIVAAAKEAARDLLQVVDHHEFAVQKALSLLEHDRCTFQHSCNVSLYAAALSKRLGMNNAEVEQVIVGGMVHDVGKRNIPVYILRKAGILEERERTLIRQHPVTGFRELAGLGELSRRQLMMVYQHHERIDGTGYPVGIAGNEIDLWGRICAVADVFEALTANRPYRGASTAAEALATMGSETGHFDADLLRLWTEVVR